MEYLIMDARVREMNHIFPSLSILPKRQLTVLRRRDNARKIPTTKLKAVKVHRFHPDLSHRKHKKAQNCKTSEINGSDGSTSRETTARRTDKGNAGPDDTPRGSEGFTSIYRHQEYQKPLPSKHQGATHPHHRARIAPPPGPQRKELAFSARRLLATPARQPSREHSSSVLPGTDQSTLRSGDNLREATED
ncbi:hypothetical protein B296_00011525 [Ensete ventricosum]|uniref:Uncharacterized protein n=1 Tax=Ensete ventricosum TaxID=4639 RepID=A0A426ZYC9_ENSVE|nr:hypothetical protein B296_00011525 [Ensete ventricosum]